METIKELGCRMLHFGPILTLVLVKTITLSTIYCSLMWWPPSDSLSGLFSLTSFLVSSGLVMYNFFSAMTVGPGYLPLKWSPENPKNRSKLQFCDFCEGYKAPRAHHCRKCGRCVMKMDHHCPWINNCVGHKNHTHFFMFLVFAVMGCAQASIVLSCSLYRALYRPYYMYYKQDVPMVYLGVYGIIWVLFSIGCAIGVTLGVGILMFYQLKVILKNQTGIEDWIVEKAQYRRKHHPDLPAFTNPYNLGWKNNFWLVLNNSFEPFGDGITWPVREECGQYDMTVEQLNQKDDKKRRAKEYVVVEDYSGSWFPISKGLRVCCRPPLSDESRMALKKDQRLVVTRWKKFWMYGTLIELDQIDPQALRTGRVKGWFPRRCAVEIVSHCCGNGVCHDQEHNPAPVPVPEQPTAVQTRKGAKERKKRQ